MSLYNVNIHGKEYKVNISGTHPTVNGEPVRAGILALNGEGLHLLRRGRQALELFLSIHDVDTYQLLIGGRRILTRVTPPNRRAPQNSDAPESGTITAPMHGLVIDVLVKEGEFVKEGQAVAVIESMKMQMQLRSPNAGKVLAVAAIPGAQVEKGAMIVQIEEQ